TRSPRCWRCRRTAAVRLFSPVTTSPTKGASNRRTRAGESAWWSVTAARARRAATWAILPRGVRGLACGTTCRATTRWTDARFRRTPTAGLPDIAGPRAGPGRQRQLRRAVRCARAAGVGLPAGLRWRSGLLRAAAAAAGRRVLGHRAGRIRLVAAGVRQEHRHPAHGAARWRRWGDRDHRFRAALAAARALLPAGDAGAPRARAVGQPAHPRAPAAAGGLGRARAGAHL